MLSDGEHLLSNIVREARRRNYIVCAAGIGRNKESVRKSLAIASSTFLTWSRCLMSSLELSNRICGYNERGQQNYVETGFRRWGCYSGWLRYPVGCSADRSNKGRKGFQEGRCNECPIWNNSVPSVVSNQTIDSAILDKEGNIMGYAPKKIRAPRMEKCFVDSILNASSENERNRRCSK